MNGFTQSRSSFKEKVAWAGGCWRQKFGCSRAKNIFGFGSTETHLRPPKYHWLPVTIWVRHLSHFHLSGVFLAITLAVLHLRTTKLLQSPKGTVFSDSKWGKKNLSIALRLVSNLKLTPFIHLWDPWRMLWFTSKTPRKNSPIQSTKWTNSTSSTCFFGGVYRIFSAEEIWFICLASSKAPFPYDMCSNSFGLSIILMLVTFTPLHQLDDHHFQQQLQNT